MRLSEAVHLKLDELISSVEGARNRLIDLEDLTNDELDLLQKQFQGLRKLAHSGGVGATRAIKGEPERIVEDNE